MEKIYCISGMGADHRIFKNLVVENHELVPVPWLPFTRQDTLQSYAQKLSEKIPAEKPILLGLSLGGMLAVEIGKIKTAKKIILVSSARNSAQLPRISSIAVAPILISLIPRFFFEIPGHIGHWFAGAKNKEERKLLAAMMKDTPAGFMRWALKSVVSWKNVTCPEHIIQIHGTKDKTIFPSNVQADHWIKGGTHIMVYNRAAEVSKIIADCLRS